MHSAHCAYYKCNLNVESKGVMSLLTHAGTDKHKTSSASYDSAQSSFTNDFKLISGKISFTRADLVTKADKKLKNVVETNHSFADSDHYQNMFPDSEIAKSFKPGEKKMGYNIQFGLAPYVKSLIKKDFASKPFMFKFDETTTSQMKKQYDGYVTFYSDVLQKVATTFITWSVNGRCPSSPFASFYGGLGSQC